MKRYTSTERLGVIATETLIIKNIGWIFREQPIVDMGIDAHIESVAENNPTGKLIGIQIKTGASHFEDKEDFLLFYGDLIHLDYWLNHSLPVILIAHLPDTKETYWVHVNIESAQRTKKRWKIEIPKKQPLDSNAKELLEEIAEGSIMELSLEIDHNLKLLYDFWEGFKLPSTGTITVAQALDKTKQVVVAKDPISKSVHIISKNYYLTEIPNWHHKIFDKPTSLDALSQNKKQNTRQFYDSLNAITSAYEKLRSSKSVSIINEIKNKHEKLVTEALDRGHPLKKT